MNLRSNILSLSCLGLLSLLLIGCGGSSENTVKAKPIAPGAKASAFASDLMLTDAPANVLSITEARKAVKVGDEVTIRGQIGGMVSPFTEGRAAFTLADDVAIISCDKIPDDPCKTPWDFCCADHTKKAASLAAIQVLDAEGAVVKADLNGHGGLKPGAQILVKGTIDEGSGPELYRVNATGIFLEN